MRTSRRLALTAGLAVLLLTGCGDGATQGGAAAVVGDRSITTDELAGLVERGLADPQAAERLGADREGFQRLTLTRMINRELLERAADRVGVEVTPGDVAEQLEEFSEQAGDRAGLEQQAAAAGIPASELEPFVRDLLLDQGIGDELTADVEVPRDQLAALYQNEIGRFEQVRSRHILTDDEAEAREVLAEVQEDPSRFGPLAAEVSTDTGSAARGGDLGVAGRGQFVDEFEDVAFSIELNTPTLVQTQFGWHVIEVLERRSTSLAEATPELRRATLQEERETRTRELLAEVGEEVGVRVNPRFGTWDAETVSVQPVDDPNGVSERGPEPGAPQPQPGLGEQPLDDGHFEGDGHDHSEDLVEQQ